MESAAVLEHTSVVTKGRRTKRQRSGVAITSTSSTRGGGSGSDAIEGRGGGGFGDNHYSSSSTASASANCNSDDQDIMSEITTEEEDMAHCLIMLARGTTTTITNTTTTIEKLPLPSKYECKTCNKIFPSFQALGGHRASHKKPNLRLSESPSLSRSQSRSPSLDHNQQMKNNEGQTKVTVRVHECSICGSEFPSGQALGGHMRRHRAPQSASASVPAGRPIESGARNVLPLDLNLPAPGDDDDKIEEESSGQNTETTTFHRVLPTPALVDCHYWICQELEPKKK